MTPANDRQTLTPSDALGLKSDLMYALRTALRGEGFTEIITPTFRHFDDMTGERACVDVGGRAGWVRSAIGPALQLQLAHKQRVYEIGTCIRQRVPDRLHLEEFTLLELYASGATYRDLLDLTQRLARACYPEPVRHISVADHLHDTLGLDLTRSTLDRSALADHLGMSDPPVLHDVIDAYIAAGLQQTEGCALLVDLPLGSEPRAKIRTGTTAVLNAFQLIINGITVARGYEQETNSQEYIRRTSSAGHYNLEESLLRRAILDGSVPADSVGLRIGLERLCMAVSGAADIGTFRPPEAL